MKKVILMTVLAVVAASSVYAYQAPTPATKSGSTQGNAHAGS